MTIPDVRITVITSTYNCADSLIKTATSIRNQSYKNIQWIVADGASTDNTLNIILSNSDIISYWSSEPDSGIYDAWNKACVHIDGDWVIFMGAGDLFISDDTVKTIANSLVLLDSDTMLAYGDVYLIDDQRNTIGQYGKLKKKWECNRLAVPAHQGVFQRHQCFKLENPFDATYKIAADSKFLILHSLNSPPIYIGIPVALMDSKGISSDERHKIKARAEIRRINEELDIHPPLSHTFKVLFFEKSKTICKLLLPKKIFSLIIDIKRSLWGLR